MSSADLSLILRLDQGYDASLRRLLTVEEAVQALGLSWEMVLVDDGALDGPAFERLIKDGPHRIPVRLARGFGQEAAWHAGLAVAQGQAAVVVEAGPEVAPDLLARVVGAWRHGAESVWAGPAPQGGHRWVARGLGWLAGGREPWDPPPFYVLVDRRVIDQVLALPERHRSLRGLLRWVGAESVTLHVSAPVPAGVGGHLGSGIQGLVASTARPLLVTAAAALGVAAFGMLLGVQTLLNWAFNPNALDGFATTILSIVIVGSFHLVALAVVGLYLAAIYVEVKARPSYLVRVDRPEHEDSAS